MTSALKSIRDSILMMFDLPTPDECRGWKEAAEQLAAANRELSAELVGARYETEWRISKDGTKRYRKVAVKMIVNRWRTESFPIEK